MLISKYSAFPQDLLMGCSWGTFQMRAAYPKVPYSSRLREQHLLHICPLLRRSGSTSRCFGFGFPGSWVLHRHEWLFFFCVMSARLLLALGTSYETMTKKFRLYFHVPVRSPLAARTFFYSTYSTQPCRIAPSLSTLLPSDDIEHSRGISQLWLAAIQGPSGSFLFCILAFSKHEACAGSTKGIRYKVFLFVNFHVTLYYIGTKGLFLFSLVS